MIQGGSAAVGRDHRGRQQERRAADPRRLPAHRGGGGAHQRAADPRHRDPGRGARGHRRAGRVDRGRTSCACRPTRSPRPRSTRRSSARIRASFLLAGPLLARFGEARMPPPGGDFIGRRRLDPHLDAFRDIGADGRRRARDRDLGPAGGLKPCGIFMDEPSVMGTENALMAAALTAGADDDRQRRLRAARPGPRPPAGEDGRPDRRHRLQRDDRPRPRQARRRRAPHLRRPHRGRRASWRWRRRPAASCGSATPSPTT